MARRSRSLAFAMCLAMVVTACGGDSTGEDASSEPTTSAPTSEGAAEEIEAAGSNEVEGGGSSETESTPSTAGERESSATGSGTAVLTIGGTTVEFSGLTCFYDEAAADAYGDEDATFAALARDGDAAMFVVIREMGLELFEVAYLTGGSEQWHMISTDAEPSYTVENGRITVEDEFDQIVDGAETGTSETGSLQATCG